MTETLKICICGAGSASHVFAGWLSSKGFFVNVFTNMEDEATRLNECCKDKGIEVKFPDGKTIVGKPNKISNKAIDVIPECNLILLPVPSLAYEPILRDIKDHLSKGCLLGATPASGGFQWVACEILKEKLKDIVLFGLGPLPFNAELVDFGHRVNVLGCKHHLHVAAHPSKEVETVAKVIERILDIRPTILSNFVMLDLCCSNALIRPARLYGHLSVDINRWKEKALFYEDMDDFSVETIKKVENEIVEILKSIDKQYPQLKLFDQYVRLEEGLKNTYGNQIKDFTNLKTMLKTNEAYKGVRFPLKESEGGYDADLRHRYWREDIPDLVLVKGIANIMKIDTPTIDKILLWAQNVMKKQFINEKGILSGTHVRETFAPQRFGYENLDHMLHTPRKILGQM